MKRFPTRESVVTHVEFSKWKIEKYFNKSSINDQEFMHKISNDFETIGSKSVHIVAKGYLQVVCAKNKRRAVKSADIPTSAHFLVTGVRTHNQPYRVAFAVSLS